MCLMETDSIHGKFVNLYRADTKDKQFLMITTSQGENKYRQVRLL